MLPGPYERWFIEAAGRASPVETRATCDACAMLPPDGDFDPATRCCTYHPYLAAHFVGAVLDGGTDAGRALVRARIAARAGVTPIGLAPSPEYVAVHRRVASDPRSFGRDVALRCPFLDGERCSIWHQRGIDCAAFHCKYDRGARGATAWGFLVVAFTVVERALARWLLAHHGLDAAACDALLHAPGDATLDARAWSAWHGREEAYFVEAARLVGALSFADVVARGGRELDGLGDAIRRAAAQLDDRPLPSQVRGGDDVLYQVGRPGTVRVVHRGVPFDALEVPAAVADRIAHLPATPLATLDLDEDLVRRLLDWQALVDA